MNWSASCARRDLRVSLTHDTYTDVSIGSLARVGNSAGASPQHRSDCGRVAAGVPVKSISR